MAVLQLLVCIFSTFAPSYSIQVVEVTANGGVEMVDANAIQGSDILGTDLLMAESQEVDISHKGTCENTDNNCAIWAKQGNCQTDFDNMNVKCPRACCRCDDQKGYFYAVGWDSDIYSSAVCIPNGEWSNVGTSEGVGHWHRTGKGDAKPGPVVDAHGTIYIVGGDHEIYFQDLCRMRGNTDWYHMPQGNGKKDLHFLKISGDEFIALGTNNVVYRKQISNPGSDWTRACSGTLRSFDLSGPHDTHPNKLYGAGMDGKIYSQDLSYLISSSRRLNKVGKPNIQRVTVHGNDLFGIGSDYTVFKQNRISMSTKTNWEQVSTEKFREIYFYGGNMYGRGRDTRKLFIYGDGGTVSLHQRWHEWRSGKDDGKVKSVFASKMCGDGATSSDLVGHPSGNWEYVDLLGLTSICNLAGTEITEGTQRATEVGTSIERSITQGNSVEFKGSGSSFEFSTTLSMWWGTTYTSEFSKMESQSTEQCIEPENFNGHHRWVWVFKGETAAGSKGTMYTEFEALTTAANMEPKCLPGCATDYGNMWATAYEPSHDGNPYQDCQSDTDGTGNTPLCQPCGWLDSSRCDE